MTAWWLMMTMAWADPGVPGASPDPSEPVALAPVWVPSACQAAAGLPSLPKPGALTSVRYARSALDRIPEMRVASPTPSHRDLPTVWAPLRPTVERFGTPTAAVPRPLGVPVQRARL